MKRRAQVACALLGSIVYGLAVAGFVLPAAAQKPEPACTPTYPAKVQFTITPGGKHTTPDIAKRFADGFVFLFPVGPTDDVERPPF